MGGLTVLLGRCPAGTGASSALGGWTLDSTATECGSVGQGLEIVAGFSESLLGGPASLEVLLLDSQSGTFGP